MQEIMYGAGGGKQNVIYDHLIDKDELQRFQSHFCNVTGVCAYCVSANGEPQTEMSGDIGDRELFATFTTKEQIEGALRRVEEDSLEELVIEDTNAEQIKLAVLSIRIKGKTVVNWLVWAFLDDIEVSADGVQIAGYKHSMTEQGFNQALSLLLESSMTLFKNKMSIANAEAESARNRNSVDEMRGTIGRIAATTEVVQLLDSDEAIEVIMTKMLSTMGKHLNTSAGVVLQLNSASSTLDVLAEWYDKGVVPFFERTKNNPAYEILFTDKPLVVSTDIMEANEEFQVWKAAKAYAIFPLMKNLTGGMCVCFGQLDEPRTWSVEDVKFISDAVKVLESILTKRRQKDSLASSYASLEAVLDNVGCCIYVRDAVNGKMLFANRLLKNSFAVELKEGTFEGLLEQGVPISRRDGAYELNYVARERCYDMIYTEINWVDGRKASLYSLYDITDKKVYQKKIEQQAYTDFLTGLYNRMCCERDLACYVDDAKKRGLQGSLLYLDLDDFKHINDGLGHQYGDALLKAISGSLSRIEGIQKNCYRMGGDEFVIVVPPESYVDFERILDNIKSVFAKPWFLKDMDYYCTMSMGIVTYPDDGDNVQDLIKKADIAMYEAKKTGKNRIARYAKGQGSNSGRRLEIEKNMRDATVAGYKEFEVFYQPIIDITKPGSPCIGAEALIRWNSTELGFIPPSDFIPLAEYLGIINPLGNYVLYEACKECRRWNDNGFPGYKVNVNLSVVQLLQTDIVETVRRALEDTGIRPRNLTLEVTESLAINDMDRMKDILGRIKDLGVRIALDDFGTGYSSLNHIREIPLDVIKVDQSFVKDLAEDAYSQSFVKMVAELAETLGVNICVEGIETADQLKILEGMKVKMIQGYYFDRPLSKREFEMKYILNLKRSY